MPSYHTDISSTAIMYQRTFGPLSCYRTTWRCEPVPVLAHLVFARAAITLLPKPQVILAFSLTLTIEVTLNSWNSYDGTWSLS